MNNSPHWTRDEDRLRSALKELTAIRGRPAGSLDERPDPDARALTVETTTNEGMHCVVSTTPQLAEEEAADVRSLVRALLDLLGHEHGPARVEIAVTPSGPRILDCWVLTAHELPAAGSPSPDSRKETPARHSAPPRGPGPCLRA